MKISVSEAEGQLEELVRRAEAGQELILTLHDTVAMRLVPVKDMSDRQLRRTLIEAVRASAADKAVAGSSAARSQDILYDDGLPK